MTKNDIKYFYDCQATATEKHLTQWIKTLIYIKKFFMDYWTIFITFGET